MHHDIKTRRTYNEFLSYNKPYHGGNGDTYPLGAREYSVKHFRKTPNGDLHIMYANRKEMSAEKAPRYEHRHLATIHPDNSITIRNSQDFGDYKMLEAVTGFSMVHESKRGGLVIHARPSDDKSKWFMHYGFKGLRIMLGTGAPHPECQYEIHHRTVKRVEAQEYMKQYEEFLTTYPVMLKCMTFEAVRDLSVEMRDLVTPNMRSESFLNLAMVNLENKHYVDAAVAFAMSSSSNLWYVGWRGERIIPVIINAVDKHFRKAMLSKAPDSANLFKVKTYKAGEYFPTSQWPLKVYTTDGQQLTNI